MADILAERVSARIEGDFVVFLIGMRVNKFWKPHKWMPAARAMMRMQKELAQLPREETGLLGTMGAGGTTVMYWRSFAHLEAYAHDTSLQHRSAWAAFNRAVGKAQEDVGIWHETFLVKDGHYETLYSGMPLHGLGKAAGVVPTSKAKRAARDRIVASERPEGAAYGVDDL